MKPPAPELRRLGMLVRVVEREARHLARTAARLFAEDLGPARLARLDEEEELAERIDAFVARFGRLQDTLGARLLPALLRALGEPVGPMLDDLDRAERLGWIESAERWMEARALRNRLVHEYVEDPARLADALARARELVPLLLEAAERMRREPIRRGWMAAEEEGERRAEGGGRRAGPERPR